MGKKQATEWLKSAYSDLRTIEYMINDSLLTHVVAFHSQQAIEKILKAILENNNQDVPKVHKLQNLLTKVDMKLEINRDIIMVLDELYIDSRYPGDMGLLPNGKPTVEDAKDFFKFSNDLFEKVCKKLNIEIKEIINAK